MLTLISLKFKRHYGEIIYVKKWIENNCVNSVLNKGNSGIRARYEVWMGESRLSDSIWECIRSERKFDLKWIRPKKRFDLSQGQGYIKEP